MGRIKTRENVKDIKILDKAAVASERMKTALVRSKDQPFTISGLRSGSAFHAVRYASIFRFRYITAPPCFCYGHYKAGTAPRSSEKSRNLSDFSLIFHEIIANYGKKHHVFRRILPVFSLDPSRICTVEWALSVNMYYSSPILLAKSNIEKLNFCHFSNVVCDGSL